MAGATLAARAGLNAYSRSVSGPPTTNLVHRFRASSLTGLSDGAAVGSVTFETGGMVLSQATAAKQPIYKTGVLGGKAVLRYSNANGSSLQYASGGIAVNDPLTVAIIFNPTNVADREWLHAGGIEFLLNNGGTGYGVYAGTGQQFGTPATGAQLLTNVVDASGNATVYKGTTALAAAAYVGTGGVSANAFALGSHTNGGRAVDGDIAEILIWAKALSTAEISQLASYCTAQYGIS